jgi:hypothetical protein
VLLTIYVCYTLLMPLPLQECLRRCHLACRVAGTVRGQQQQALPAGYCRQQGLMLLRLSHPLLVLVRWLQSSRRSSSSSRRRILQAYGQ